MDIAFQTVVLFICLFGLWKGADIVVDSASAIARKLGFSDLVIGLTVVAMATSAPEFAVTISAALSGNSDISVGNVVGSNIFNLFFILGLIATFSEVKTSPKLVYRDGLLLIITSFLLVVFLRDLNLSRLEGSIFLVLLVAYIFFLLTGKEEVEIESEEEYHWYTSLLFLLGILIIVISGHYFVDAASGIARILGVSEWVIGVTIVAAGTSAPEMATSLVASLKGKHGLSAGNLIGSDIFNLLGVLGVAAIIKPLTVASNAYSSVFVVFLAMILVVYFFRTNWEVSRKEGYILLLVVLIRWAFDFWYT